ncbi:MAG: hypothetical protein J7M08_02045 [Planctomycetes bacterium]|nr:hypothetical protein [Planctomycetota bacterium]
MAPKTYEYRNIFPPNPRPRQIAVADIQPLDYEERALFAVLQGLVNREEPRIYLLHWEPDRHWPRYYAEQFDVQSEAVEDPYELLRRHADAIEGVALYDPELLDTLNLAAMIGAQRSLLPLTPALQSKLSEDYDWARNVAEDLRGRFANGYECDLWAFENLFDQCNRYICVNRPLRAAQLLDYVVAHKLFVFNVSESMKDRREAALADRIYQAMDRPCHVMGWYNGRVAEVEHVARVSLNGCFATCSGGASNLSVHAGIPARPTYAPRTLSDAQKQVEKKVYITFTVSDGDALWCMNNRFRGHYDEPQRGQIPMNWEMQMLLYHLAPGQLHYYFNTMTENDYPIASLSGAGYTYPNLHPDPVSYLKYSERYMDLTGLNVIYAGTQDPYGAWYWGEHEPTELVELYRRHVPGAIAFIRNYGAWGVPHKQRIERGKAPFFCSALYVNVRREIADEIQKIVDLEEHRPLFLTVHVRESCPMDKMVKETRTLRNSGHEVVNFDEFVAKLNAAQEQGLIGEELYPSREAILGDMARRFREQWAGVSRKVSSFLELGDLSDEELDEKFEDFPQWFDTVAHNEKVRTVTTLEDDFGFAVLYAGQVMARFWIAGRGVYLSELAQGRDYILEHLPEAQVIAECIDRFLAWEEQPVTLSEAKALCRRLKDILPQMQREMEG